MDWFSRSSSSICASLARPARRRRVPAACAARTLVDVAVLPAQHHGAAPFLARHQAVRDQPFDGVAHRRAADRHFGGDVLFAQPFARQEGARHQAASQFPVYVIAGVGHGEAGVSSKLDYSGRRARVEIGAAPTAVHHQRLRFRCQSVSPRALATVPEPGPDVGIEQALGPDAGQHLQIWRGSPPPPAAAFMRDAAGMEGAGHVGMLQQPRRAARAARRAHVQPAPARWPLSSAASSASSSWMPRAVDRNSAPGFMRAKATRPSGRAWPRPAGSAG